MDEDLRSFEGSKDDAVEFDRDSDTEVQRLLNDPEYNLAGYNNEFPHLV